MSNSDRCGVIEAFSSVVDHCGMSLSAASGRSRPEMTPQFDLLILIGVRSAAENFRLSISVQNLSDFFDCFDFA